MSPAYLDFKSSSLGVLLTMQMLQTSETCKDGDQAKA